MSLREACASCIVEVANGKSLNEILDPALRQVPPAKQALARELVYGTLRWHVQLDWILHQLLHKPLKTRDAPVQALLLIGLYQLRYGRTGSHIVVSESVETARQLGFGHQSKLVNAVLRNYQRRAHEFAEQCLRDSIRAAHPQWLVDRIRKDWPGHWRQILSANNQRAPMTLRVNLGVTERNAYLTELRASGIAASSCAHSQAGIQLDQPVDVLQLPGFTEGLVSVQDEAAQLAATILAPQPGERVLDACAAPGGKTGHLLECAEVDLVALDTSAIRLRRVRDNLSRLGKSATLLERDARNAERWWDGTAFDRILVDAPCSATGVIRRHPDIKLLRRAGDIGRLATLQREILDSLWPTLATGGSLLYATCSVMRKENEQVMQEFLEAHPEAETRPIGLDAGVACAPGRQLLPTDHAHDGFYYALLGKRQAG